MKVFASRESMPVRLMVNIYGTDRHLADGVCCGMLLAQNRVRRVLVCALAG